MPFGIPPQIIPLLKPLQGNEEGGGGDGGQGWGGREDGSLILSWMSMNFTGLASSPGLVLCTPGSAFAPPRDNPLPHTFLSHSSFFPLLI